jgi:hypothetical protein
MQGQSISHLPDMIPHAGEERGLRELSSLPASAAYQKFAVGGIALLLLAACWGAWVLLIGFRPCALSSLLWR